MENYNKYQAAQFKAAMLLKKYNFGAASTAKYLGKSRGLIQSWIQTGNDHYLAKEKIKFKSFKKILKELRRNITLEHLDYFLAKRLIDLDLPAAFVSKILDIPTSTVRSWRHGKVPVEVKKYFYDDKLVDREFKKLMKFLKTDSTNRNLEYYQALNLANVARKNVGRKRIGGRIISEILTNHYGYVKPIPDKTVSCWINGSRKPWGAFKALEDEQMVQRDYKKIVDELTYQYMEYHLSKSLADKHKWKYSKISKILGLNKELVRGWIKKDRGNPVAKTYFNPDIIKNEVKKYLKEDDLRNAQKGRSESNLAEEHSGSKSIDSELNVETQISVHPDLDIELERELIYHLETLPLGVSSPSVLKSILVNCQNASIKDIEKVLKLSQEIIQNDSTGKWMLKKYAEEIEEENKKDVFARFNCKERDGEKVAC
jgi:predicted transcriptional regulator